MIGHAFAAFSVAFTGVGAGAGIGIHTSAHKINPPLNHQNQLNNLNYLNYLDYLDYLDDLDDLDYLRENRRAVSLFGKQNGALSAFIA